MQLSLLGPPATLAPTPMPPPPAALDGLVVLEVRYLAGHRARPPFTRWHTYGDGRPMSPRVAGYHSLNLMDKGAEVRLVEASCG